MRFQILRCDSGPPCSSGSCSALRWESARILCSFSALFERFTAGSRPVDDAGAADFGRDMAEPVSMLEPDDASGGSRPVSAVPWGGGAGGREVLALGDAGGAAFGWDMAKPVSWLEPAASWGRCRSCNLRSASLWFRSETSGNRQSR